MKNALLIISHGSRRAASNVEVFALTDRVRTLAGDMIVKCAFLKATEPTVQQMISQLAQNEITDIQVFPHFLAAGAHVTNDIPREIEGAKDRYPDITFHILPHLGSLAELPALIAQTMKASS